MAMDLVSLIFFRCPSSAWAEARAGATKRAMAMTVERNMGISWGGENPGRVRDFTPPSNANHDPFMGVSAMPQACCSLLSVRGDLRQANQPVPRRRQCGPQGAGRGQGVGAVAMHAEAVD